MRRDIRFAGYFSLIILAVFCSVTHADDRSNARGMGMSFASMVTSFGTDAFGVNPANFDLHFHYRTDTQVVKFKHEQKQHLPKWEFSIMSIGGSYGSDLSMDFYNNYLKYLSINRNTFTGLFTNIGDVLYFRQTVLPPTNTEVNYDFELKWLSINYSSPKLGSVNFTVSDKVGLNTDANGRDIYMPWDANNYQTSDSGKYNLVNLNLNQSEAIAWWLRDYKLSFAKNIDIGGKVFKSFAFGISVGMVDGFGCVITYASSILMNTYGVKSINGANHVDSISGKKNFYTMTSLTDMFQDYRDGAKSHYDFFPRPAGKGYSLDLGFNAKIGDFRIAASVTDIGSITWNYNTIKDRDTNSFIYRNFFLNSSDPTYNAFVNDLDGFNYRETNITFSTSLPTTYRAGIAYQPNNKFVVEFNWIKGDNSFPTTISKSLYSAGTEIYITDFLPIRGGFSVGGMESWTVSLGTGLRLRNIVLDFGAGSVNNLISNKRLSLAFSTKIFL